MKKKFNKKQIMQRYYSDEELKNMKRMSVSKTLQWLEAARHFINNVTPQQTKKIQRKMIAEGW